MLKKYNSNFTFCSLTLTTFEADELLFLIPELEFVTLELDILIPE